MLRLSGADAVMIGRAAVGRPWLVGRIASFLRDGGLRPAPSRAERCEAALDHYDTLLSLLGPAKGNRHARKHLCAYADHLAADPPAFGSARDHAVGADLRARMATSDDPAATRRMLIQLFELPPGLRAAA